MNDDGKIIGKRVRVVTDRKLGTRHPNHPNIVYEVNYGFVEGVIGGDGEEQDAYILGVDRPVGSFDGVVTAVIKRLNDAETKWVVVPDGYSVSTEEIAEKTRFQERFFEIEIIR